MDHPEDQAVPVFISPSLVMPPGVKDRDPVNLNGFRQLGQELEIVCDVSIDVYRQDMDLGIHSAQALTHSEQAVGSAVGNGRKRVSHQQYLVS